jgi:hypothetical protein
MVVEKLILKFFLPKNLFSIHFFLPKTPLKHRKNHDKSIYDKKKQKQNRPKKQNRIESKNQLELKFVFSQTLKVKKYLI